MATHTNLTTYAGYQPSGRRSFRKQRTVNPAVETNVVEEEATSSYQFCPLAGRRLSAAVRDK
jgi:hypothetical protein